MEKKRFWLGVVLAVVGIVLIFLGFFTEPIGEIHGSVLGAVGELLTLSGALVGADAYVELKVKKMFHKDHTQEKFENEDYTEFDDNKVD